MATPDYSINYEDEQFTNITAEKNAAINNSNATYDDMIGQVDGHYDKLIENTQNWADKQTELQNQQTQHTIDQINQQKDQAQKDYVKEQSGAYVDWQKQSNAYGSEAEKMASAGLANTGYSESSQVSMYNTYQNRVATARESFQKAVLNYDNSIKDAQLQNSSILAEIAQSALEQQLKLSLEGFQYKNSLILEKADKELELKKYYSDEWQRVLNQINTENQLAESARQHDETLAYNKEKDELDRAHNEKLLDIENKFKAEQARLEREHEIALEGIKDENERKRIEQEHKNNLAILEQNHKNDLAKLEQEHKNNLALIDKQNQGNTGNITGGNTSSSTSGSDRINKANGTGYTGVTNAMRTTLNNTKTGANLTYNIDTWLNSGMITEAEAKQLYKSYIGLIPLQNREWEVVDDGGWKLGKLNDDMKVTDGVNTYTIKQIYNSFKSSGFKNAKDMAKKIQDNAKPKS